MIHNLQEHPYLEEMPSYFDAKRWIQSFDFRDISVALIRTGTTPDITYNGLSK